MAASIRDRPRRGADRPASPPRDDIAIAVTLIDAQFPPYEQVIPKEHKKVITVDRLRFVGGARGRERWVSTGCASWAVRARPGEMVRPNHARMGIGCVRRS